MPNDCTPAPSWLEPLCQIALQYRTGELSVRELFQRAAPDLADPQFLERVAQLLSQRPELVAAWQQYAHDKRGAPSPYLEGTEVGFADVLDGRVQVRGTSRFESARDACSAFILREALWVLERREVT